MLLLQLQIFFACILHFAYGLNRLQCSDPLPEHLMLCGSLPGIDCNPDDLSYRCQTVQVDTCTEFSSNTFEEFGLTEIYAQVTATCDATKPDAPEGGVWTFGYQIFRRSTCEGNPFGFEVKQSGMELDECAPLELPFVDNQVDFTFVLSSDAAGVGESVKQEINSVISEIEGIEDASIKDASIAAGESVKQEINSVISEIEGIGDASSAAGTLTCQTVPFAIFVLVAPLITTVLM